MHRQLILIEVKDHDWPLDEQTKETGRRGIASAREALRQAAARAVTTRTTDRPAA